MEKWETHVLCFFLSRFPSHKVGGQIGMGFAQFLWIFFVENAPNSNSDLANPRAEKKKIVHHRHLRRRRGENEEAAGFVIKKGKEEKGMAEEESLSFFPLFPSMEGRKTLRQIVLSHAFAQKTGGK